LSTRTGDDSRYDEQDSEMAFKAPLHKPKKKLLPPPPPPKKHHKKHPKPVDLHGDK
jgi:hypothetical protein